MNPQFQPKKELAQNLFKIYHETGTVDGFVKEVLQKHMSLTEYTALVVWHSMNEAWLHGYKTTEGDLMEDDL